MVTISPELSIYNQVRLVCDEVDGIGVYTHRPNADASYPFVQLAEQYKNPQLMNKDTRFHEVNQTLTFFHNDTGRRGTLDGLMTEIAERAIRLERASGRQITSATYNKEMTIDTSTSTKFLHGTIELNYVIN